MKTICFFAWDMSKSGGTERVTLLLSEMLATTGRCRVFIVDFASRGKPSFFPINRDVVFCPLTEKRRGPFSRIAAIWTLRRFLKKIRASVLITAGCSPGAISVPAVFGTGIKHILWDHSNVQFRQDKIVHNFLNFVEFLTCDRYVTLTERNKRRFSRLFRAKLPWRRDVLRVIYNPSQAASTTETIRYDVESKTILTVGRLLPVKGYDLLVEVARKVFAKHSDWRWDIYGDISEPWQRYADEFFAKIQEYSLQDNLRYRGKTTNIEQKYREAAMLVATSRSEGLPMVLIEAKSLGLPLISFDVESGPDEIIRDGENGYLIPFGDVDAMAEKINDLIERPEKRRLFSQNAKIGLELFEQQSILAQWESLF